MKKMFKIFLITLVFLKVCMGNIAHAQSEVLNIFACEPEWAALVKAIGGNKVDVFSATSYKQDPHYIEARPSLIARARKADMLVCTGADLEVGWLPVIQRQSANANIQNGSNFAFFAYEYTTLIEIPESIDPADGHIHAHGNPHFHLDPRRLLAISEQLTKTLIAADAPNESYYQRQLNAFKDNWQKHINKWQQQAQSLKGKNAIVHHRTWSYLFDWLGINTVAELEPKPGLPPTVGHLRELIDLSKNQGVDFIVYANYQDAKGAKWLSEKTEVPSIKLAASVNLNKGDDALIDWMDTIIQRLLQIQ